MFFVESAVCKFDKHHFLAATITCIVLYLLTGLASAYLYHQSPGGPSVESLMPGLLFTSATVIVFILTGTVFRIRNLLLFYAAMYAAYVFVFYLTFFSTWFGFIIGISTGGLGAFLTFWLTDRFIKPISFSLMGVLITGGLAFIINDLFLIAPVADFIRPLYVIDNGVNTMFAGTFLLWQAIVGIKLLRALRRSNG
jgi:hypothetical protein